MSNLFIFLQETSSITVHADAYDLCKDALGCGEFLTSFLTQVIHYYFRSQVRPIPPASRSLCTVQTPANTSKCDQPHLRPRSLQYRGCCLAFQIGR